MFALVSCKPSKEDATKYNNNIIEQQILVVSSNDTVASSMGSDIVKLEIAITNFNTQVTKSIDVVTKMDDFNKEATFKNAALTLFKSFKAIGENEYKEILRLVKIPNEKKTETDDEKMMATMKKIDDKLQKELEIFIKAQKDFAAKWKFEFAGK
jgi:hypothetical protein